MAERNATNFGESLIPGIRAVLEFAASSGRSAFYRKKYSPAALPAITSVEDLARIPFLEKGELSEIPWRDRLFMPESELGIPGITSGTTGKPLIIPRLPHYRLSVNDKDLGPLGVKTVMILLPVLAGFLRRLANIGPDGITVIPGDVRNIELSAALAHELGVNGILTTYTGLDRLIEAFDALKLGLEGIKWVSVGGEPVSPGRYRYLRSRLPGARLAPRFASAEFGATRFYRCERLLDSPPDLFHPFPGSHLFEIIAPSGELAAPDEPGELIHTDITVPKAFPFIRYRTGDGAALLSSPCACGSPHLLKLTGKIGFDSLNYAGATLRLDMVELALERVADIVEKDFRLHLREENSGGKPLPELELCLLPKNKRVLGPAREELELKLAGLLSSCLHVSSSRTLGELVGSGIFRPLKVTLVDAFPAGELKPRRLISHINAT